jgi:hypothetical protein
VICKKQELFTWLDQQDHWTLEVTGHYVKAKLLHSKQLIGRMI